jgi:hypothetical protein
MLIFPLLLLLLQSWLLLLLLLLEQCEQCRRSFKTKMA